MNFDLRVSNDGIVVSGNNGDSISFDTSIQKWKTVAVSPGGVTSFNGRTGAVLPLTGDYDSDQIDNLSGVAGASVSDALDTLASTGGFQTPNSIGNLGATPAINFATNRYQKGTLNANAVPTFTLPVTYECYLELTQAASGGPFVVTTWPATVKWSDGQPPVLSTAANAIDLIKFVFDGTNLRGYVIAMAVA